MNRPVALLALALSLGVVAATDADAKTRRRSAAVVDLTVKPKGSYLQTPKVSMPGEPGRRDVASGAGIWTMNGNLVGMPSSITSQSVIVRPDLFQTPGLFQIAW